MSIDINATISYPYKDGCAKSKFGENPTIRKGTIIYGDVTAGDFFQTGHNVLIREKTTIGDHVVIGTNVVIDGKVEIGSFVKIETGVYIPTHVNIGSDVFIGPNVTLTNDKLPLKDRENYHPDGPTICDGVTLCAGVIVMPGIQIGENSFVAAGTIVTKNVPPNSFVIGTSAGNIKVMPKKLEERNMALSWMKYK